MIVSRCPLRVSLVGGSTDLQAFLDKYDRGKVISFPINLYTYITMSKRHDKKYQISYSKTETVENPDDIKNDVAREVIKFFGLPPITMMFNSDIPASGSGLASSSSYTVAAVAAACRMNEIKTSQAKICEVARKIELIFNPLTGYQDCYGCGLPSVKIMEFSKEGIIDIEYIELPPIPMLLKPTNIHRSSGNILKTIDIEKSFELMLLVNKAYQAIKKRDNDELAKVLNEAWEVKKKTSEHIVNEELIEIENKIKENYRIWTMKLCGAGGGGYFFIMTGYPTKGNSIEIEIDHKGVITWDV